MRWLLLLLLTTFGALADLPTIEDPSRGQGQDIMETLQNYGFDIVMLLALAMRRRFTGGGEQLHCHLLEDPERTQAVERSGLDGGRR